MRRVHTHEGKYRLWMYGNESDMNFKVGEEEIALFYHKEWNLKHFFVKNQKFMTYWDYFLKFYLLG